MVDKTLELSDTEQRIADEILTQNRLKNQYSNGELTFQEYRSASINQGNGWSECLVCDWGGSSGDTELVGDGFSQQVRFYCPQCGSDTKRINNTDS